MNIYIVVQYRSLEIKGVFDNLSNAHLFGNTHYYEDYHIQTFKLNNE